MALLAVDNPNSCWIRPQSLRVETGYDRDIFPMMMIWSRKLAAEVRPDEPPGMAHLERPIRMDAPLFERFLVLGSAPRSIAAEDGDSISPEILFEYPSDTKQPVPPNLSLFCFPEGFHPRVGHPNVRPDVHVFLLTTDDGILYGVCMTKWELLDAPLAFTSAVLPPITQFSMCVLVAPRCYCLVSKYPFFLLHHAVLSGLLAQEEALRGILPLKGTVPQLTMPQKHALPLSVESVMSLEEGIRSPVPRHESRSAIGRTASRSSLLRRGSERNVFTPRSSPCSLLSAKVRNSQARPPCQRGASVAMLLQANQEADYSLLKEHSMTFSDSENITQRDCHPSPTGRGISSSPKEELHIILEEPPLEGPRSSHLERTRSDTWPPPFLKHRSSARLLESVTPDSHPLEDLDQLEQNEHASRAHRASPTAAWREDPVIATVANVRKQEYEQMREDTLDILDRYHRVPMVSPGEKIVFQVAKGTPRLSFLRPQHDEEASLIAQWGMASFFRAFSLDVIFRIMGAVLLEKKVLFSSSSVGTLSATVSTLIPLLRPFVWQFLFVPILPSNLHMFMEAPVPFILGIPSAGVGTDMKQRDDILFVDVDSNTITSKLHVPPIPRHRDLYEKLAPLWETIQANTPQETIQVDLCILSVFKAYMNHLVRHVPDLLQAHSLRGPAIVFSKADLICSFPEEDRAFMKEFVHGQMFFEYVDRLVCKVTQ